jgi:hypothetical protein
MFIYEKYCSNRTLEIYYVRDFTKTKAEKLVVYSNKLRKKVRLEYDGNVAEVLSGEARKSTVRKSI